MGGHGLGTVARSLTRTSARRRGSHLDLHAALNFQHALVQQAEKVQGLQEHQRQGRDHRGGEVGAQECDAVHQSTGHAEAWPQDGREAYDVDAVHSKAVYSCSGQGHITAKCGTSVPAKGKEKDGGDRGKADGKDSGKKDEDKESGMDSAPIAEKDEANNDRMDIGEVEKDIGGFEIGCVDKEKGCCRSPPGFPALRDEDEPNLPSGEAVHEREGHRGIGRS